MGTRRVVWNSASGIVLYGTQIVIAFLLTPYLVDRLGDTDYALWELLLGLVGYLGILDLGITPALMRFVAHADGRGDRDELRRVFNSSLVMVTAIGVFGALALAVAGIWGDRLLAIPQGKAIGVWVLFLLLGADFLLTFIMSGFAAYILGIQQHWFINAYRVAAAIAQALGIWFVLQTAADSHARLVGMAAVVLVLSGVQLMAFAWWVLFVDRRVRISPSDFSRSTVRSLLSFGAKNALIMGATTLLTRGILFVVAHTAGVATVVYFLISARVVQYATGLVLAAGVPLTPFFAAIAGRGGAAAQREYWFPVTRVLLVIGVGVQVAVLWLGETFIALWISPEHAHNGRIVLYALSAGSLLGALVPNGNRVLISLGKHGQLALLVAVISCVLFVASIPLTAIWSVHGAGVTLGAFAALVALTELVLACRALDIRLRDHLVQCVVRVVVPVVATSATFATLASAVPARGYLGLLGHGAVGATVWLATSYFFILTREDRAHLSRWRVA